MLEETLDYTPEETDAEKPSGPLFLTIWLQPSITLRYALAHYQTRFTQTLFALGGIGGMLRQSALADFTMEMSFGERLAIFTLIGAAWGWIFHHIYAWAMTKMSVWLGGKDDYKGMLTVLGWSLVPLIANILVVLIDAGLYYQNFNADFYTNPFLYNGILISIALLQLVLNIWSVVILVKGIQIIQKFTAGKSFLVAILPFIILICLTLLTVFGYVIFEN